MNIKHLIVGFIVLLTALIGLVINYRTKTTSIPALQTGFEQTINIGLIYPLTGSASAWGIAAKEGVELAIHDLSSAESGNRINLFVEDSRCKAVNGVNAINKLINVDKVKFIIGDICSSVVIPTAPIAEEQGVIMIAQGSSPDITPLGEYIFRNWPSDTYQGNLIAEYAFNKLGIQKIGILNVDNPYGKGLADVFESKFKTLGGSTVRKQFKPGEIDFRGPLLKFKKQNLQNIYLATELEDVRIARQVRELGLNVQILGADTLATPGIIEDAQGALDGAIYSAPYFDKSTTRVQKFITRYEDVFNKNPEFPLVSAHGYDATMLLAQAIREVGNKPRKIIDYLYSIDNYPGVSGDTSFDRNGDAIKPYAIYQINGTKHELIFIEQ